MKTYSLEVTKHPKLFRVVDREGNWRTYAFVKKLKDSFDPKSEKPITFDDIEEAAYLRGVTTILGEGYPKDKYFQEYLSRTTQEEQKEKLEKAGEKGSKVHNYIDMALSMEGENGGPAVLTRELEVYNRNLKSEETLSDNEWDTVLAWREFWLMHSPILLHSEVPFYNLKEGYAGTGDVICILTRECEEKTCACKGRTGKIGLLDWKTGAAIYPYYFAQVASYAKAENVKDYLPKGKKIDYAAVVRISPKLACGYKMEACKDMKEDYQLFLNAKRFASKGSKAFDPAKDIEEVPDSFQLAVQRYDFEKKPKAKKVDPEAVPSDLHLSSEFVTTK